MVCQSAVDRGRKFERHDLKRERQAYLVLNLDVEPMLCYK